MAGELYCVERGLKYFSTNMKGRQSMRNALHLLYNTIQFNINTNHSLQNDLQAEVEGRIYCRAVVLDDISFCWLYLINWQMSLLLFSPDSRGGLGGGGST